MKGKVCGDFCEFTLDKGHFITDGFVVTHDLIKKIKNGMYDETLKDIYVDGNGIKVIQMDIRMCEGGKCHD